MSNLHDQIKTLDRQVNEGGEFIKDVKKNTGRIEVMEARERRKNLIIKGLRQERRLERPNHLEGILKRFFKQTLNVTAAKFEEVLLKHYTYPNFSFLFVSVFLRFFGVITGASLCWLWLLLACSFLKVVIYVTTYIQLIFERTQPSE